MERIKAAGLGNEELEGLLGWRSAQDGAGEVGGGKDVVVLRLAGGEAENAERRERELGVENKGMKEPLEEAAENARRIYRGMKEDE